MERQAFSCVTKDYISASCETAVEYSIQRDQWLPGGQVRAPHWVMTGAPLLRPTTALCEGCIQNDSLDILATLGLRNGAAET